ncbi:MAG: DUF3899 domain-containing protein [Romboutsia sp.]
MKVISILISINLFFSLFYTFFSKFELFSFINCSFVIGMFYLMFGVLCFVWEKGFFNLTIFSFNRISQNIRKKRGLLIDEADITIEDYISRENHFSHTTSLLTSGILISSITTFLSFSIYF